MADKKYPEMPDFVLVSVKVPDNKGIWRRVNITILRSAVYRIAQKALHNKSGRSVNGAVIAKVAED